MKINVFVSKYTYYCISDQCYFVVNICFSYLIDICDGIVCCVDCRYNVCNSYNLVYIRNIAVTAIVVSFCNLFVDKIKTKFYEIVEI